MCNSFNYHKMSIDSKADAMHFAILATMSVDGCKNAVNYEEAKKLFDFFCENVDFPADAATSMLDKLAGLVGATVQK